MVERSDIEAKVRQIEAMVEDTKETVRDRAVLVGGAAVGVLVLAVWIGRRRGRKSAAVVEVYRIA